MLAPETILQERYRIIRLIRPGGMGAVYEALDKRLSSVVALKETFSQTNEGREAFLREAKLLANLSHPALPRVTDFFSEGDEQYLVMEFIRGNDLEELLRINRRAFPLDTVLDWAEQALNALEELHSIKPPIVHRDIKPANLKQRLKDG